MNFLHFFFLALDPVLTQRTRSDDWRCKPGLPEPMSSPCFTSSASAKNVQALPFIKHRLPMLLISRAYEVALLSLPYTSDSLIIIPDSPVWRADVFLTDEQLQMTFVELCDMFGSAGRYRNPQILRNIQANCHHFTLSLSEFIHNSISNLWFSEKQNLGSKYCKNTFQGWKKADWGIWL